MSDGLTGTICNGNLEIVKMACSVAHSDGEGKDWSDDASEAGVSRLFMYVDRQTKKILNLAGSADTSPDERAKALYHLGLVVRGMEEFYLKSNYLEQKIQESDTPKSLDPYNIEPINWTRIGKDQKSILNSGLRFGDFDKSSPKTTEGAKKIEAATYFSMAKELAFKETQRQWNTIERLIRVRYPQKATEIVIALKNASCDKNFKPDSED
jgi:hypothetical protein